MRDNLTEIIFILDRSGSMGHLTKDTIGGYNAFIESQRETEGEALITTILFDNECTVLNDGIDLKNIKPLTNKEYFVRGATALLDAIGITINKVGNRLNQTNEKDRPSKVMFVITTDGDENSSREFNRSMIKEMITIQQEKYKWQFMFLGANIDAISEAESLGISEEFASNYTASSVGTDRLYSNVSQCVSNFRAVGKIDKKWKDDIEKI